MLPGATPAIVPPPSASSLPAPPVSVPAPAAPDIDIDEEIEEIEFFMEQGLPDEAKALFDELYAAYSDDNRLNELKVKIDALESSSQEDKSTVDELDIDSLGDDFEIEDITEEQSVVEVDDVFNQFKAGVEKQIAKSDHSTHFDLGQAYKDMGLWDDAIGEFKIAGEDAAFKASAEMMIGMCHVGAGRFEEAVSTFDNSLKTTKLKETEKLGLMYEKGKVFELMSSVDDALSIYNEILNIDPGFADVVDRIDSLE
jgi:tetratricopeptide (TPR) repeat protein